MRAFELVIESKKDENGGGDCFIAALEELMDSNPFEKAHMNDMSMVHAVVTGQGPIEGIRHVHAWVEVGDVVIDKSNGNNIVMRKEVYYKAGQINPDNPAEYKKYNRDEMIEKVEKRGTYGPWELVRPQ